MNRTLKTAGVSLALLTACLSANTVFADGQDKADISCSLSFFGNRTNISWNDTGNSKISSYKLYVSEPLSPDKCCSADIPLKYVEDSSKLTGASTDYDLKDLEKGKYYRFKLEAYQDSELVGSDTFGSIILGEDYEEDSFNYFRFGIGLADLNTATVTWNDYYKGSMKFYRIEDDGFHDFGTVDLSAGTYTFSDLQSGRDYSVAAEVYEGEKMIFTYQFGFSTEEKETKDKSKDAKDSKLDVLTFTDSGTQIRIKPGFKSDYDPVYLKNVEYKIRVSKALSSKDYFACKDTTYTSYLLKDEHIDDFSNYYIPYNGNDAFDHYKIYKEAGKYYGNSDYNCSEPAEPVLTVSGLKPDMYYRIKTDAYLNGKMIASCSTDVLTEEAEQNDLFYDSEEEFSPVRIRTASKDGKTVKLTWEDLAKEYDYPEGKRTVYFYLSSPYKNRKKIYDSYGFELSAQYVGKTAYSNLKYKLKDLKPGRHYMLYLEVRLDGKIECRDYYRISTTVNVPVIALKQTKKNTVKVGSAVGVTLYDFGMAYEAEYDWEFDSTCIKPEFVEYYRKEKKGKYRKIATLASGEILTDKTVSLGKTYTYKARGYSIIGGKKVYSAYSPIIDIENTIRVENLKPQFKISYANKDKNIVKITSDRNNGTVEFMADDNISYNTDGKNHFDILSQDLEIKPGKSIYLKLSKKNKDIALNVGHRSSYYVLSVDLKKLTYKTRLGFI